MQNPQFWYKKNSILAKILLPLSWLWLLASYIKTKLYQKHNINIPIIVIGNATTGGTGKTPTAIYIAKILREYDKKIVFISRGYKGQISDTILVNDSHNVSDTGDEVQILKNHAPVIIGKNRIKSLDLAYSLGFDIAILDDGLQNNPSLYTQPTKFFNILVCDAARGVGNGLIMPAGPLREKITTILPKIDAILWLGDAKYPIDYILKKSGKKILLADKKPITHGTSLEGQNVIAFAGIGNPSQFFDNIQAQNANIIQTHCFPDHHDYNNQIIERLINDASRNDALLVTTEKDMVKISPKYYPYITPFLIELDMESESELFIREAVVKLIS